MFHPQGPTFWELARQALSSTERGYDLLAPKFDYTPFRTPPEVLNVVSTQLANGPPIETALDICCGTGAAMEMLRPLVSQQLVGLDRSQGMLGVAQERLAATPSPAAVRFVRGEALRLPFGDQFDLAVCFGALGHILPRDEPTFVREIHRILRPGGRFVFVTSTMPSRLSFVYWAARSFNFIMHVRNLLIRPPFIMYYLTFLLPECDELLTKSGFDVKINNRLWHGPLSPLQLVIATKRPS
ncbi:MAG: methyltransferase domain-containing protein [Planctomycetales bacterium]|nr:methyltransferase domain-containing protein [Planctomycetales bacterium]